MPTLQLRKTTVIGENNGSSELNPSDEQAQEFINYLSAYIREVAEDKKQELFNMDFNSLKSMAINYCEKLRDDDRRVTASSKKLLNLRKKVQKQEDSHYLLRANILIDYIGDIASILKSAKFNIPEDLQKEMACGKEFDSKVVKAICENFSEKLKKSDEKIKELKTDYYLEGTVNRWLA